MKIELTIPRRAFVSLAHIVSKDRTRYMLNGFNVRSLSGYVVITACNGVHLVSIQLSPTSESFDVTLPFFIPKGVLGNCMVDIDTEANEATYREADCKIVRNLLDGIYPNFLKAVPALVKHTGEIAFNIGKLNTILDSALAYSPKGNVFIAPNEKDAATVAITDSPEWFGLLMPIHHVQKVETPKWLIP